MEQKKYLFYAMTGEKMCFQHILMNALDLTAGGATVRIVLEGRSVALVPQLLEEKNPLFAKCRDQGLVAGICYACSHVLGVLDANQESGIPLLRDMNGHAGVRPFVAEGYQVISI
ncbi:MAG: hypothetical protein QM270_01180 [Bacillota bacterium]|nr:hypothetical protein [Bacillota bacterium]